MTKILRIAPGAIDKVQESLQSINNVEKILYVSDPIVNDLYGTVIREQLNHVARVKEEIVNTNTIAYAMSLAERVIATDIDCIVGVGGGKVLDVCKYAAFISKKPFLSVPTAMANDGIASPIAVLKRQDDMPKSLGCAAPTILLVDTKLIMDGPVQLIKAGIGDTISNYMALKDWTFAVEKGRDQMNGYAYLMSQTALDVLMKTQYHSICQEFMDVLARSLVLSGCAMEYAGSSRPVSGSEHLFSHALDYYSERKNLHGIQVALGTVAVLKLLGDDYQGVLHYLNTFEVDINPTHLGIDCDTFVYCMQMATSMRKDRFTYLDEINLENGRLKKIYKELLEEL